MSEPKRIVMVSEDRIRRAKTAILTQATSRDQFRVGEIWLNVGESVWQPGLHVNEVNHFGRHRTELGDTLIAERLDGVEIGRILVRDIQMAAAEKLGPVELTALGYESREDFQSDWGAAFAGKVWLMHIDHVTPQGRMPPKLQ